MSERSTVYLIHFDPPYKHARHYVGYTTEDDVDDRLERHRSGRGAKLCRAAAAAGSVLVLARTWKDVPRRFENKLKGRSVVPLCPLCSGEGALDRRKD